MSFWNCFICLVLSELLVEVIINFFGVDQFLYFLNVGFIHIDAVNAELHLYNTFLVNQTFNPVYNGDFLLLENDKYLLQLLYFTI